MTDKNNNNGNIVLYQQLAQRLDSFEQQLVVVGEAIVQIARTEERVSVLLEQNNTLFGKLGDVQNAIKAIEIENAKQTQSLSFFERIGWIVVTAVVGGIAWLMKG